MSSNDAESAAEAAVESREEKQAWGRVLICGGTDWPKLGKKERGGKGEEQVVEPPINPDLLEPHILRSLSNVPVLSIHTSCAGCHFVCLSTDGVAWLFGRNGFGCLGIPAGPQGDEYVSENAPIRIVASDLGAEEGTRFVSAACGRNHTLLVDSEGSVWAAGANAYGQCGVSACNEVADFTLVKGLKDEKVVQASAGINFSVVLTESGKVFCFGSGEKGQLGNGTTGERITTGNKTAYDIEPMPIYLRELDGKKIVQIASGQQHSLALDETGVVHVWGYNGYCRLGLGNQVDALKPKVVPQFAGPNDSTMGAFVAAGPSNSVVIDRQGMYWMAGKWKNSGEGSSGSPYSSFRYMPDIMACKIGRAACGGVTHWALTPDDDNPEINMTVGWGQNAANGELGLGEDQPKSATKPAKHLPLSEVDVFDIAPGQNTTLFLARPSDQLTKLPRHPEDVEPPLLCVKCDTEQEGDDPLECDKCDAPWHLACLDPPLVAIPAGEWFCVNCAREPGAPIGTYPLRKAVPRGRGRGRGTGGKGGEKKDSKEKGAGGKEKEKGEKKRGAAAKEKAVSPMDEEDGETGGKRKGAPSRGKNGGGGAAKKSRR